MSGAERGLRGRSDTLKRKAPTSQARQTSLESFFHGHGMLSHKKKLAMQTSDAPEPAAPGGSPRSIASKDSQPSSSRMTPSMPPRSNSAPHARAGRKLVIRSFTNRPEPRSDNVDPVWEHCLREAVRAVHTATAVAYSYEDLYQRIESICRQKRASDLYDALRNDCETHIEAMLAKLAAPGNTMESVEFLSMMERHWQDHCNQMETIGSIFLYLDRTYVIQSGRTRSLWDMGIQLFRKHLVAHAVVERRTVNGILAAVDGEREGEAISHTLMKNLLRIFTAVGRYASSFERPFLEATDQYYHSEGVQSMQSNDVPHYLKHVEKRLGEEASRVLMYLDETTRRPLIACVEKNLLAIHAKSILDKGFDQLMDGWRVEDLSRLYKLFGRINSTMTEIAGSSAHDQMKASFMSYVKRVGAEIVLDSGKDGEMVNSLLAYKDKLDQILAKAFSSTDLFTRALKESFEAFLNMRQNVPAMLIAKFVDHVLRTGNKSFSEEELESTLERVMTLFRFIHGKDIFEAFYKKYLAKRLLFQKSASHDLEKLMLAKLKSECGAAFTNKLEGMFKDVDVSKDIMVSFAQHVESRERLEDVELNVYVLTNSYWPQNQLSEIKLPRELIHVQETFKKFYLSNHEGRQLSWLHSAGTCVLRGNFPRGQKLLDLSLYQAVVLVLFNDAETLNCKEIFEHTGIEDAELRRTLLSLASGKPTLRVLNKNPKGPTVSDSDVFTFNSEFVHKLKRVKINAIQVKETKEENQQTTEKVFQERHYLIDAAVVRILKTRKVMAHAQLISELYDQLKFPHKSADLKKRIESLIERDYIERDENNTQNYKYIA